ncbi:MAG: DUF2976 domain-containing protein [Candidatus Sedimenticola endophacoides]
MKRFKHIIRHPLKSLSTALTSALLALAALPALAVVPTPPTPSTNPGAADSISWFEGVFEDTAEVGILAIGVILFIVGAAGMVWAVVQVMGGKATIAEVGKIGIASAAAIAFGTWALTQASAII